MKKGFQYRKKLGFVLWDISDLLFAKNKYYQYQVGHLDILRTNDKQHMVSSKNYDIWGIDIIKFV